MAPNSMTRELRQLIFGFIGAFAFVIIASLYYGVVRSNSLVRRPDNPRRAIAEETLQRGMIVDRNGVVLATSSPTSIGSFLRRIYPYPDVIGGIGYFSYTHGTGGLEDEFNDLLRGQWTEQNALDELSNELLHRQPTGGDLRTTLDLRIQQHIAEQMGNRNGGAVVINVPDGAVLAMVSQYMLDPNALDANWDIFGRNSRQRYLRNHITEGLYRPGSAFELVMLAGMLANGDTLNREIVDGTAPVSIFGAGYHDNEIGCVDERAVGGVHTLNLMQALAWGCPQAFVQALGTDFSTEAYQVLLTQLGFLSVPPLYDFRTVTGPMPPPLQNSSDRTLAALGQGDLTVAPLQLARFVAAIANGGNVPPLYIADAYRLGGEREWQALDRPLLEPALIREEIATQLREAMQFAADNSYFVRLANNAELAAAGYELHGHVGVTYTLSQNINSWFLGFMDGPDGSSIVVVVLIEDAESPGEAAVVAGEAFQATVEYVYK